MSGMIFNRRFQLWMYHISHSQLVFRAGSSDGDAGGRIDLLFKDVDTISVPVRMNIATVRQVAPRKFEIEHDEGIAVIEAGSAFWLEDDRDFFEPSQLADGHVVTDFDRAEPEAPIHSITMVH